MGRSLLSIKLAVAFGLCIAVMVLAVEHVRAGGVESRAPQSADSVAQEPTVAEPPTVEPAQVEVVCLWRGCPGTMTRMVPGKLESSRTARRRIAAST